MRDLYVDFYRDWRRWSKAERLSAGLLVMMSLAGSAALFLS
jgi:hypothetical protein